MICPSLYPMIVVGTSFSASVVAVERVGGVDYVHDGRAEAGLYDDAVVKELAALDVLQILIDAHQVVQFRRIGHLDHIHPSFFIGVVVDEFGMVA